MKKAISFAKLAAEDGETPVGCVIADADGKIIGTGRNRTESVDATCHAEMDAIRDASRNIGSWRLNGCSLYVTMEPCPMCAGAILNSRIKRIYYGAKDRRLGACGGVINIFMENFGYSPEIYPDVLADECKTLLSDFFKKARDK